MIYWYIVSFLYEIIFLSQKIANGANEFSLSSVVLNQRRLDRPGDKNSLTTLEHPFEIPI